MKLEKLFKEVTTLINKVDFSKLWKGFYPLKFALYNDKECFFDGKYIEKTNEFIANTAIKYKGEWIAIWNVMGEIDLIELCSKMIHEMFHGFQQINQESRFPDEMDAVYNYKYNDENLSLKMEENKILLELFDEFNLNKFNQFLKLRKYRYINYNYEFIYESKIECIEGSANFIEFSVLQQLSLEKYNEKLIQIKECMLNPKRLFPIRICSYDIGAILLKIIKDNNINLDLTFNEATYNEILIKNIQLTNINVKLIMNEFIEQYFNKGIKTIDETIKNNVVVMNEETTLLGFNVYNAFCYNNRIISTYFVMFGDIACPQFLYGNFVIETKKAGIISKIYKIVE